MMLVSVLPSHAFTFGMSHIEGITFAADSGQLYLPVDEAVKKLHWPAQRDEVGRLVTLNGMPVATGSLRQLTDGTELVSTADLAKAGAAVTPPAADGSVTVANGWRRFILKPVAQHVMIDLGKQRLEGWQGERRVLVTRISSGKNGRTPAGEFKVGPYRAKMHRSSLYNDAPMPWSVQINGNIFVHGFSSVPAYPASHGCIRVPLTEGNPARFFYEWVQTGTPVSVVK